MTEHQRERLGPPPVDAMSDVAWARVERKVFSRMEATGGTVTAAVGAREIRGSAAARSHWVWLAVPAAAAAAFALAFFSMNGPSGSTQSEEPSRIVAGSAPSSVTFGDTHLTLDANTALVMDQAAAKPTALLEHGSALFTVPARGERQFTVLAGDTTVRTANGQFRVSRDGELAQVKVDTGTVRITFRGHDVTVAANHSWSALQPADVVDNGTN